MTIAVPFAFNPQWTGMIWTLEASLVYIFATLEKQPHLRLSSLIIYIMAVIMQLGDYHASSQTLLAGSFIGTLLTVTGGMTIFFVWQNMRESEGAIWEKNAQYAVLLSIFIYSLILPMLVFMQLGTMMVWAIYSVISAFWQRNKMNTAISICTLLYTLGALFLMLDLMFSWRHHYIYFFITAGCFVASAYWLHNPRWLIGNQRKFGWLNKCFGWIILIIAVSVGIYATSSLLLEPFMSFLGKPLWWILLPTFAFIAMVARVFNWREANSASFAFLPLFFLYMLSPLGVASHPVVSAFLLSAAGLLHLFILNNQNEEQTSRKVMRVLGLLMFTILWTKLCGLLGVKHLSGAWCIAAWIIVPTIMHLYVLRRYPQPENRQGRYRVIGFLLLGAGWTLFTGMLGKQYLNSVWEIGAWLLVPTFMHLYALKKYVTPKAYQVWQHVLGFLILGSGWAFFVRQLGEYYFGGVWMQLSALLLPLTAWFIIDKQEEHPYLQQHQEAYLLWNRLACVFYSIIWLVAVNWQTPLATSPLPYIALLNPIAMVSAGILLYGWRQIAIKPVYKYTQKYAQIVVLVLAFYLLNAEVMRVWHFYMGVKWQLLSLLASIGLQASLSIVWAIVAIALMVTGNQVKQRYRWLLGAGLMAVVVLKLFIVELSNTDSIARIISFIVVGLLLLLVGWFAPLPPEEE